MTEKPVHSFHVPVMGTAFTVDTPIKVAPYGISSVISIGDDELCENMRQFWCAQVGEEYVPIGKREEDGRARRITEYLNLVNRIVKQRFEALRASAFEKGSEITKYFEMLKDSLPLKQKYVSMLQKDESEEKKVMQDELRSKLQVGSIDVNIMTKIDRTNYKGNEVLPDEFSDAISALRGYANSTLTHSSIVFSAGFNRRLYAYIEKCPDFFPNAAGDVKKRVILKVSDFRSSLTQGKFLAKKGVWVYEHRIESGLNCGGHAFATDGYLLGPILDEFKRNRAELFQSLFEICNEALQKKGVTQYPSLPVGRITVQGGIGTAHEDEFLLDFFKVDGTGWATPFLLVPEVTNVDAATRQKLADAGPADLYLSKVSPLGVPFNSLRDSESERVKQARVVEGNPGSDCPKGHLVSNTEFTKKPVCTASKTYQKLKIKQLMTLNLPKEVLDASLHHIYEKSCLCEDLAAPVLVDRHIDNKRVQASAVCPGPNLAYFSTICTLSEMVSHIYGRVNLLNSTYRSNMFISELKMYIDYWAADLKESLAQLDAKKAAYFHEFKQNLLDGIAYYKTMIPHLKKESEKYRETMKEELAALKFDLEKTFSNYQHALEKFNPGLSPILSQV